MVVTIQTGEQGEAAQRTRVLTVDEYKAQANALDKVGGALEALGDDPIFEATRDALHDTCQKLGDGLAFALAALAREADKDRDRKKGKSASVGYYADDIWQALGRYTYPDGDDAGVGHLTSVRYAVEHVIEALTPEPTPAEIAEAEAQKVYKAALEDGLSDHEARETAWPSAPADYDEAMVRSSDPVNITEYEREQAPS